MKNILLNMLSKFIKVAPVLIKLGLDNVIRFGLFKLRMKCGVYSKPPPVAEINLKFISADRYHTPDFSDGLKNAFVKKADDICGGYYSRFSGAHHPIGTPPDWSQGFDVDFCSHWTLIKVNTILDEDVKCVWDISRFTWAPYLAAAYSVTCDEKYLIRLNFLLSSWCEKNTPQLGVNWVCSQEVSVRMLNIFTVNYLLGMNRVEGFEGFVSSHCHRISQTTIYAISQQNNHVISEAAALFVGGAWLNENASNQLVRSQGGKYKNTGIKLLEKSIKRLVMEDGAFSMYSINYHRVVLDTLCLVEFWRRFFSLEAFSEYFYETAARLVDFLYSFIDEETGRVPNIGTNDGSRSFLLTESTFDDFRPSIQVAAALFHGELYYGGGSADAVEWMSGFIDTPSVVNRLRSSMLYKESGFVVVKPEGGNSWVAVRYPRYRFRPSHQDMLHVDLWFCGRNILRDTGTFSYNTFPELENYFKGPKGHNTIQFDDRDPMARLGAFLLGDWLKAHSLSNQQDLENNIWFGSYRDRYGCNHSRHLAYKADGWVVEDRIDGSFRKAILRWHLEPGKWSQEANRIMNNNVEIEIRVDHGDFIVKLVEGFEALFYGEKTHIPVLEVELSGSCKKVVTYIRLGAD